MLRRQALRHVVVQRDRLVELVVAEHVEERARTSRCARCRSAPASRRSPGGRRTRRAPRRPAPARRRRAPCRRRRWPRRCAACMPLERRRRRSAGRRACRRSSGSPIGSVRVGRRPAARRARRGSSRCTISRRRVVQRCPAVPAAANDDAAHGEIEVGRRARRSPRCCRRARGSRARSGRRRRGATCAAHRASSRWRDTIGDARVGDQRRADVGAAEQHLVRSVGRADVGGGAARTGRRTPAP